MSTDIILDPKIRDWVLIPLTILMLLMNLGRHFAAKLMRKDRRAEPEKVKDAMTLNRAKMLGMHCYHLPRSAYRVRMAYFNDPETGILMTRPSEPPDPMKGNPMSDPNMMMDMMGNNMIMMVPNLVMMPAVSYFFAGFLTAKLPFSLTPRFKLMLQRGVEVTSLDVSYVSSLSWYFMLWMGLRGVMTLILVDGNEADEAKMMEMQMSGGMAGGGQPGQPQDMGAVFKSHGENLDVVRHKWIVPEAEQRLIRRSPSIVVA